MFILVVLLLFFEKNINTLPMNGFKQNIHSFQFICADFKPLLPVPTEPEFSWTIQRTVLREFVLYIFFLVSFLSFHYNSDNSIFSFLLALMFIFPLFPTMVFSISTSERNSGKKYGWWKRRSRVKIQDEDKAAGDKKTVLRSILIITFLHLFFWWAVSYSGRKHFYISFGARKLMIYFLLLPPTPEVTCHDGYIFRYKNLLCSTSLA
jgi:hypothetical protein